jgi:hypothetical protein
MSTKNVLAPQMHLPQTLPQARVKVPGLGSVARRCGNEQCLDRRNLPQGASP